FSAGVWISKKPGALPPGSKLNTAPLALNIRPREAVSPSVWSHTRIIALRPMMRFIHPSMSTYPKSPKEMTGGMMYFPRMLDKIRLHGRGELGEDYLANLGKARAADGACANFLRVKYDELRERVLAGGSDEEILEWCYEKGRRLK